MKDTDPWLARPSSIRLMWWIFVGLLIVLGLADAGVKQYNHFGVEGIFGFGAWFGFLSAFIMVIIAKVLAALLKRPDDYYGRDGNDD